MLKVVVVHSSASQVERDWSRQYAGLDADVKAQFLTTAGWQERSNQVFTIAAFTWDSIVATVKDACKAAGAGGVVIIASGHGGSVPGDLEAGIINWDATDGNVDRAWDASKIGKGLFWDETVAKYTDPIPFGSPPTQKQADEENIQKHVSNFQILQKRHDAFEALQRIGSAIQDNKVGRLTFTVCTAGRAPHFIDRLAKHCHAEVACFNQKTMVLDDATFNLQPGKARLILERDQLTNGSGTNTMWARVFSPDLDDRSIAHVGTP